MAKWIKFEKGDWGFSASMTVANKVSFFIGTADSWGISAKISFYDQSLVLQILNLYTGFEIYHRAVDNEDEI